MKWRKRIRERDGAWRGECEIVGDGAPLVRAAETEKFPAGRERKKGERASGGRRGDSWENRKKRDKGENDAERDRPRRRERGYDATE